MLSYEHPLSNVIFEDSPAHRIIDPHYIYRPYITIIYTKFHICHLHVPRHRNGKFSTDLFERYQHSEQALLLAMMEIVVNGVSTRKVQKITEQLCGKKFSKSTVSALCKKLDPLVHEFRMKPLQTHYPFLIEMPCILKCGRIIQFMSYESLILSLFHQANLSKEELFDLIEKQS